MSEADFSPTDRHWMALALTEAHAAAAAGEVPVGAVLVKEGVVLAQGHNLTRTHNDPTAHAEMVVLRQAAAVLGNHRLDGCSLYVTLEPCAMCSGAVLHARLARVVYGAADPKTGAAGSVLDVFGSPALNHQTRVQSGVLAQDCGLALQAFFKPRRTNTSPLREDALRTPQNRFAQVADMPWVSHHVSDLPSLDGLRMHHLDVAPHVGVAPPAVTWLALHPPQDWCHRFSPVIAGLVAQGHRVLAPDLIGFGRSDKPKKERLHTRGWHLAVLKEWLHHLDARRLVLLLPEDGHGLGRALQQALPERFLPEAEAPPRPGVPPDTEAARDAPFPDAGHRAGPRAFATAAFQPDGIL